MCAWHPALGRPSPHSIHDRNSDYDPWRDDGSGPKDPARPARRRLPARALLVGPSMLLLFIGLGIEPGWGRFLACVGLLLLGILVVVTWVDPARLRSTALKTLYLAGFAAYVATLFV